MGAFFSTISGPKPFKGQKYIQIRNHYIKIGHNIVYKDLKFPACETSLTVGDDIPRNVEWKRPIESCDNPNLLVGLLGQNSVVPGVLSQPWIVCAFSLLAARTELWHWVVPQYRVQCYGEQPLSHPGIFHFHLWYRGEWVDVVIDDCLPFLNGQLIGAQSSCHSEWWPALLEKAYAKLLGSYAALKSVELGDVLVDFTGGVSEKISLSPYDGSGDSDETIWPIFQRIKSELMHQSLVAAWVKTETLDLEEGSSDRSALGLELGQPYLIVAAKKVSLESSTLKGILKGKAKVAMVRLCNPSQPVKKIEGIESTDKALEECKEDTAFVFTHKHLSRMLSKVPDWSRLSDAEKQKMGLIVDDEREFWMPFEDFLTQFSEVCMCRLLSGTGAPPLSCGTGDSRHWNEKALKGVWKTSTTSSAPPSQTLLENPQFLINVPGDKGTDIVVQLLQWMPSITREDDAYPAIGVTILKVEDNRNYRLHSLLAHCPAVLNVSEVRKREANGFAHLPRGRYLVVPHTEWQAPPSLQHINAQINHFLLRCFASTNSKLRAVTLNSPPHNWWQCFSTNIECITVVTVKSAEGLKHNSTVFGCSAICEIKCEGTKVRTPVAHNSTDPIWDRSFVFYRKTPTLPLTVRVLNHRTLLPNVLIGEAQLPAPVNHQPSILRADLLIPGQEDGASQGVVILEITTEDDLTVI